MQTPLFVASFTDAWIETTNDNEWGKTTNVASFTDAWIETLKSSLSNGNTVASFTDAWIETFNPSLG